MTSSGDPHGERPRARGVGRRRVTQTEPDRLVEAEQLAQVLDVRDRRGEREELAIRERGVVRKRVARRERRERVEVERMDRITRAPCAEGLVRAAEVIGRDST